MVTVETETVSKTEKIDCSYKLYYDVANRKVTHLMEVVMGLNADDQPDFNILVFSETHVPFEVRSFAETGTWIMEVE